MSDNLLQEIDQALRADRAAALWHTHKRRVLFFVAAIILAAAANSAYESYRESRGGTLLSQLLTQQKLLTSGKAEEAAKGFAEVAGNTSGELKALALIWQSRALVAANNKADAVKVLIPAADGTGLWADVACIRLAPLDSEAASPCLNKAGPSPLAGERAEWAAANRWAAGDVAAAKATLETLIADENTSQEARARMLQWVAIMKSQEEKTK